MTRNIRKLLQFSNQFADAANGIASGIFPDDKNGKVRLRFVQLKSFDV